MPLMIGYQLVASATGKTEDQVREDRKAGLVDLDSLDSLVDYIARARGWVPASEIEARAAQAPAPIVAGEPKQYAGTRQVKDNVEPSGDPYLDRVKGLRGEPVPRR